jgi:hypothetical protein
MQRNLRHPTGIVHLDSLKAVAIDLSSHSFTPELGISVFLPPFEDNVLVNERTDCFHLFNAKGNG